MESHKKSDLQINIWADEDDFSSSARNECMRAFSRFRSEFTREAQTDKGASGLSPELDILIIVGALLLKGYTDGFSQAIGADHYGALKTAILKLLNIRPRKDSQRFKDYVELAKQDPAKYRPLITVQMKFEDCSFVVHVPNEKEAGMKTALDRLPKAINDTVAKRKRITSVMWVNGRWDVY